MMSFAPQINTNQKTRHQYQTTNLPTMTPRREATLQPADLVPRDVQFSLERGKCTFRRADACNLCGSVVVHGFREISHPGVLGGDLRAARVSQRISPHARIALPESGGLVLSDALIVAVAPA